MAKDFHWYLILPSLNTAKLRSLNLNQSVLPRSCQLAAEKIKAIVWGNDKATKFAWKLTAQDAIYAANRIPEIADSIVEIDNAMTRGYNLELGQIPGIGCYRRKRVR